MFSNNPIVDIRDLNVTSLIFVGDIHGEFGEVLKNINMISDSIQVYCGDIGMGFYKSGYYSTEFNKIQKRAEKKNCTIIFIRKLDSAVRTHTSSSTRTAPSMPR